MFREFLSRKKQIKAGFYVVIGFMLSPLSWWNDLFVNIPLAYLFAYLLSKINPVLFFPTLITTYWLTNLAGLLLMHVGIKNFINKEAEQLNRKTVLKHLAFTVIYTLIMILAVQIGWLKLPNIN